MQLGVNVPNFGPGTSPSRLRDWAQTVEGLGYEVLMASDHLAITPDVAKQYPAPFYEPFTTLAWLAGVTRRVRLGTSVLVVPYRHPLQIARLAANLNDLSEGRFILGVGVGWARQEYDVLGVPFEERGRQTDSDLRDIRAAWRDTDDYRGGAIPIWVGGSRTAALRRAVRLGDAWHPLRFRADWLRGAITRLEAVAAQENRPMPALAPRIILNLTDAPAGPERLMGEGTIEQVLGDLAELRELGAEAVVLDPFQGDPQETLRPEIAWQALATVTAHYRREVNEDAG
ncbi:LLM class flavin-dependent oxidoreductase [Kribbella deserti]|uniref:LLM class flavin-dependent oxidoreductase n=1 Tax=Kribbella deserti TaxID=1926257 RepID=A0ABV6QP78_9ACTN